MRNPSPTRSYRSVDSASSLSIYHTSTGSCHHDCWTSTASDVKRVCWRLPQCWHHLCWELLLGTANTASSPSHSLGRRQKMGSTEKWEAWLPANNYVTGKNRPVVSVSRIHSARTRVCRFLYSAQSTYKSVSLPSLLCCSPGESEAALPEDTYLLLSNADTFKNLALTSKGKSGRRYTAPISITNDIISAFRNWTCN